MDMHKFWRVGKKAPIRCAVWLAYWFVCLLYLEFLLHAVVFDRFTAKFFYVVGFTLPAAAVLALICSFIPHKAAYWTAFGITVGITLFYGSQLVYYFVFGGLYSLVLAQQGGSALTSFWRETLLTMWDNIGYMLLLLVPIAVLLWLKGLFRRWFRPLNPLWRVVLLGVMLVSYLVTVWCLQIGGKGYFSTYDYYHSSETTTEQAAEHFGLLTAMRLELTGSAAGDEGNNEYFTPTIQEETESTEETLPDEPEYNVLELDFDYLNTLTKDKDIQELNNYFASLSGTQKNEYTGLLADYNLIYICAESFDTGAIHPEVTPTLYKLANQGIIFNNYYNTYPNVTTDGEYTMCLGIYPDTTRKKSNASFRVSQENYLPYALGNIFSSQKGIQAYGYHNYKGSYYGRNKTHPNMGYTMKFMNSGMKFTTSWPSSDLEMMKQSVDDFISQDQFHAYYMTFSGHYKYDTEVNLIAKRNWDAVKHLSYSDASKAYLSCHVEMDKALEYLLQKLEEAGVADKTAIVIAGDHFPYGLTKKQYGELVGYTIDDFSKQKSSLIFWVGGLEENIVVDEYCSNADILPTVLNLWGFDYDSRLLAGTDVFSDGLHVAVLRDYSFYTDKVWFNASKKKVQYLVDESEVPEGYVDQIISMVKTKYKVSADMLYTDYYRFVYENSGLLPKTEE